jgi:L-idonate 5-dehydrogenase
VEPDALAGYGRDKGQFGLHIECSGSPAALASGVVAVRPGGTILQLGLGGDMSLPVQLLTQKEITLKGSFRFDGEFALAVELMRKGRIDVKPLITHVLPLADGIAAFALAADRRRAMKVQLDLVG